MTDRSAQRIWSRFEARSSDAFLVTPGGVFSYRQAARGIGRWLSAFDVAGAEVGDRIVIRTDRDDVASVAFISALVDGVVPVLLEGTCPDQRLKAIVDAVEPKLVLSDGPLPNLPSASLARQLEPEGKPTGFSFLRRNAETAAFGLAHPPSPRPPRLPVGDGLAYLMFTSGTTSAPSGVEISRKNLAANLNTLTRLFGYDAKSRIFNDMILAHADGMIQGPVLAAWCGGAVLRAGGFEVGQVENWLGQVRQMRATHVITVPTVWSMIDLYAAHNDYFDAPECRILMTVAAKMPEDLQRRLEARFARPLVNHYGLTETVASALYSGADDKLGAIGSLGHPVDCEARIAEGADEGELQLRGENVFSGYWRNPERTRQSFTSDNWFRTGDLVRRRQDGSYDILGRLKTVIMSGGVLIRPEEIDEAMQRHPAVIESVTVGLPDEMFGEIGVTGVVLNTEVPEVELTEHLRNHVEPRKVPKRIVALAGIPHGPSGKPRLSEVEEVLKQAIESMSGPPAPASRGIGSNVAADVLGIAAEVFRVHVEDLSPRSAPEDVEGWDSFTHLNLILMIERRMNLRLGIAQVSAVRRLGDLIKAVETSS